MLLYIYCLQGWVVLISAYIMQLKTLLVRMHLILITFGHTCTCFVIASLLLQYYFSCIHETTSSKREMFITFNYILFLCPQTLYLIDYNVFIIYLC